MAEKSEDNGECLAIIMIVIVAVSVVIKMGRIESRVTVLEQKVESLSPK